MGESTLTFAPDLVAFNADFTLPIGTMVEGLGQVAAIKQAFIDAGADPQNVLADLSTLYGNRGLGATVIAGVNPVSSERVAKLYDSLSKSLASLQAIKLNNLSVTYTLSNCASAERATRRAAIADARRRAQETAQDTGVKLGPLIGAATVFESCPDPLRINILQVREAPKVSVTEQLYITYALLSR